MNSPIRPAVLSVILLAAAIVAAPGQPASLPSEGILVIDTSKVPPPSKPVYRAETVTTWRAGAETPTARIEGKVHFLAGPADRASLSIDGAGSITSVTGKGLAGWAERWDASGARLLEVVAAKPDDEAGRAGKKGPAAPGGPARVLEFVVEIGGPAQAQGAEFSPALPGIGEAAGFSGTVVFEPADGWGWEVVSPGGLEATADLLKFVTRGGPAPKMRLRPTGSIVPAAALSEARVEGTWDEATRSVVFVLTARATAREAGARIPFLRGFAAVTDAGNTGGWTLVPTSDGGLDLVAPGAGSQDLRIAGVAAAADRDGWRTLDFAVPAATITEIAIAGLPAASEFREDARVRLERRGESAVGWLPASGICDAAWRGASGLADPGSDTLYFNATARTDIRVGPGLVNQDTTLAVRVLQGRMESLEFLLEGRGDIVDASGTNSSGWQVADEGGRRTLRIALSRPVTGEAEFRIRSQSETGAFPAVIEPLRLVPVSENARLSGLVRIARAGAVRFDVTDGTGLMQVSPARWEADAGPSARPSAKTPAKADGLVYQFPSAKYALVLEARQVFPEVAVNQVTVYEIAAADRVIRSSIELDINEAPLRDWEIRIPEGYAVASLTGTEVADYQTGEADGGTRPLRVLFGNPVQGRAAIELRLETGSPAAAGTWDLPALGFPGAKSVRGFVGVASAPGFRLAAGAVEGLAEAPTGFFPSAPRGLQLAFRQREAGWSARVAVEALGQSVAADLYHLYSLREGAVFGSVVLNYFVVGAPVGEWRLRVPQSAGNLAIDGQDVRSWRREGGEVIVSLDRPALGAATLLATFEHPMPAEGGRIALGAIEPVGASSERGYIQVVSPLQVKSTFSASGTLLGLEASELPPELRLLSTAPSLGVYEYASRPFALELGIEWFPRAETLPQIVDFAKLETRVSSDGQIMTDAKYFVKARGAAPFVLALPKGAKLWEARVGGQLATARSEGGRTLVPLPAGGDPESAVEVSLRYGSKAWFPWRVRLAAPTVDAPVLAAEWTAAADPGRVLVAGGSPALHASLSVPASGFAWLAGRSGWAWAMGGVWVAALVAIPRAGSRAARFGAAALAFGFVVVALAGAAAAMGSSGVARSALQLAVPITANGRDVAVGAWNLPASVAALSFPGLLVVLAGVALWLAARLRWRGWSPSACWIGWWVVSLGILMQPRGGFWFCLWVAAGAAVVMVPRLRGLWAAAMLAAAGAAYAAAPPAGLLSVEESCVLREGTGEVEARFVLDVKDPGGAAAFLLGEEGVPTAFSGDGLTLRKISGAGVAGGGQAGYYVSAARAGRFTGTLRYTFPISGIGGLWKIPGGPAAARTLSVRVEEPGWMFSSTSAVRVAEIDGLPAGASGVRLTLLPAEAVVLDVRPVKRDPSREPLGFFASSHQLIVPGPGVVRGRADLRINVSRGEMRELRVVLPAGFLLESVGGKIFTGAPQWNFDPATREARIALPAARRGEFSVQLDFQKPSGNLPGALSVEPVRAAGAEREGGLLALAFPGDAQPEALVPEALTIVNFEDFPSPLPEIGDGRPTLHRVFRFEGTGGRLELRVLPVEPEIRATVTQTLSVGSERCVLSTNLVADIRRSAIFRLSFPIPAGWEIESASGDSLAQWIETGSGADRKGVFQLTGRTSGEQSFAITLVAPGVPSAASWAVPRIIPDGSARTEGSLVVTPERGLRLRPVARTNCSPADPRESGDLQPGALAFRILQQDWKLDLAIEPMDPWITAQSLEDVEIREGQIRHSADLIFRADHAAIKSVNIHIPGLDDDARKTVRIEGEAIADFAPAADRTDTWEIRFRRGMLGEIPIRVEFQRSANPGDGTFAFQPVLPEGTRQTTAFAALRATGRLEIPPPALPAGWESADWNAVPAVLKSDAAPPSACLRVAVTGGPLTVAFRRQEIADALKLRVAQGEFATVFSPRGDSATVGRLGVRVNEKSTMRVSLPGAARLVRIAVNGEDTQAVKDGADYLFYVVPPSDPTQPSAVEIAYGVPGGRGAGERVALSAPGFNAPLENLTWRVSLPVGWGLRGQSGDLELRQQTGPRRFSVNDYLARSSAARDARTREAGELITKAGQFLREGDQGQARAALNKAAKTRGIDEATNEDARVQLQNLASQQAVLGLNTRRQKLYLDNAGEDTTNDQLARAARANPFLQGRADIAPAQIEQVLQGNTLEEAGALRRLADRLVSLQLAAEPAPVAVAPTLPEAGESLTFTRALQVDGSRPLDLKIAIERKNSTPLGFALILCTATGLAAWSSRRRG